MQEPVPITGLWLRSEVDENYAHGPDRLVILVEVDGEWRHCLVQDTSTLVDSGPISHIVESSGIRRSPVNEVSRA